MRLISTLPIAVTREEIEAAVREVRNDGLLVISLNMAGSVPDASDLVVTDPVQAGRYGRDGGCRYG